MKKNFRIIAVIAALVMILGTSVTSFAAETGFLDVSKSKGATNLDKNYESEVTLSLPAASYKGDLDVAFVVDGSFSVDEDDLAAAASDLLEELAAMENLKVKVSVTVFGGSVPVLEDTELMDISEESNLETVTKIITDKKYDDMDGRSGSNLQAGVEAANVTLDADTEVAAENKYMIIMTDGAARMWIENGEAMSQAYVPHKGNEASKIFWNSNSDYLDVRYKNAAADEHPDFAEVWAAGQNGTDIGNYGMTEAEKNAASLTDSGVADYDTVLNGDYYTTYEAATYYAATSIVDSVQEYNVIMVTYPYHDDTSYGQYIEDFKAWLDNEGGVTRVDSKNVDPTEVFADVRDELIYVVGPGSTVIDEIGMDFDFVNDINKMALTIGGVELDKTALSGSQYGFGELEDGGYLFVLTYHANGHYGYGECFEWQINTDITVENAVQLTYSVKLANPSKTPGTYGQYDQYGENGYSGLSTNNTAILFPVDSEGNIYEPEEFNKPTVSYTVEAPVASGGTGTPATGDDFNMAPWCAAAVIAALVAVAAATVRRQHQ